jgi:hypothetical protein
MTSSETNQFAYAPISEGETSLMHLEAFSKLIAAMRDFAIRVRQKDTRREEMEASSEYAKVLLVCEQVIAAGNGRVQTVASHFKYLLDDLCSTASRPSEVCYAGDLEYVQQAYDHLKAAYAEAFAVATTA